MTDLDWIFGHFPRRPGDRVLDLAPETGVVARTFADGVAEVVDDPEAALPLPDGPFDAALWGATLHRCGDPRAVLIQVHEALRPGGWLGLADLVAPERAEEADAANAEALERDPGFHRALSGSELQDLLVRSGFEVAGAETRELSATSAPVPELHSVTSLLVLRPDA